MLVFVAIFVALGLLVGIPFGLYWFVRSLFENWTSWSPARRTILAATPLLLALAPYGAFKLWEHRATLARVPAQLHASSIDYRLEKATGIGMPGDNETGFIVYSLDKQSAEWAKRNAARLHRLMSDRVAQWRPTPVDFGTRSWRYVGYESLNSPPRNLMIANYLNQYGFAIPVDEARLWEVERVIRNPGSVYAYGPGGSLTIVDPANGKFYFIYAG